MFVLRALRFFRLVDVNERLNVIDAGQNHLGLTQPEGEVGVPRILRLSVGDLDGGVTVVLAHFSGVAVQGLRRFLDGRRFGNGLS